MSSKSSRMILSGIIISSLSTSFMFGQEWYDQLRSTGSSLAPTFEVNDDQGTYRILLNWQEGYMEFEAGATADMSDMVNDAQAISVSKKTARFLAYQKAAEFLYGAMIEGKIGLGKSVAKMDIVEGRVNGMVKNAVILNEDFEWKRNRSGTEDPWATVKIGMLLWSDKPDQALLSTVVPEIMTQASKGNVKNYSSPPGFSSSSEVYSGLIVNAKGLHVTPSLAPTISVEGDVTNQVYGPMRIDREYAIRNGIAGYEKDLEKAKKSERVTRNGILAPMVVDAVSVSGANKTNVEVSREDANKIVAADTVTGFLKECRVIFLVD